MSSDSSRERAIGLKCNDCGRRYGWNRNIERRKKCEECGCQWLELWSAVIPDELLAQWPAGKRKWSDAHYPIATTMPTFKKPRRP